MGEAQCERNLEIFLQSIEAVSGKFQSSNLIIYDKVGNPGPATAVFRYSGSLFIFMWMGKQKCIENQNP